MLVDALVRNYFERYASFNNIRSTSIGENLVHLAEEKQLSFQDCLYQMIGFNTKDDFENAVVRIKAKTRVKK